MTESLIPEDPVITIPDHDWKIVEAIRKHYADYQALLRVNELDGEHNILDKDSSDNLVRLAELEYANAEALADVLGARCSPCDGCHAKRKMVAADIINGQCFYCKTMIVRGQ